MKALSIRQPWAWLILNGGKDVENRDWRSAFVGPFLIHAAKGMTRDEYEGAVDTCHYVAERTGSLPVKLPPFKDLERGGIVGMATMVGCTKNSASPWFFGEYAFELRDAMPLPFTPYKGALGFFDVPDHALASTGNAVK